MRVRVPLLTLSLCHLLAVTGLCRGQGGDLPGRLPPLPRYRVPPLRGRHRPHDLLP
jgi:hypothetical protein